MEEFQRQAGILGYTILDNEKMAEAIVNASFKNATFSERIWTHQELLRAELEKLLRTGLLQGRNPRELARQIRKVFNASVFNSERLLRTELARVQTEAQKQSFIRNGFDEYMYITSNDFKVCSTCKPLNGRHFKVENMTIGDNAPPMHPLCRCSTAAYIDDKAYEDWLSGYKDHGLSYADWKAKNVEKSAGSGKIKSKTTKRDSEVHFVGKIDKNIYKCITDDITTDEVIITERQVRHIIDRRGEAFYNKYGDKFSEIIKDPDYIFKDDNNTALVCKGFLSDGKYVNLVLRLVVSSDNPEYKNSIITAIGEGKKRFEQRLRNNDALYKK